MRIAVDVMGTDRGVEEMVAGALMAAADFGEPVTVVGDSRQIGLASDALRASRQHLNVVHADEVIEMSDQPALAVRSKRSSSVMVAYGLVAAGEADAAVSVGNTGAAMAAGLSVLHRIRNVDRPAIAIPLPTASGMTLILDGGANTDCKPLNLLQFGYMGSAYFTVLTGRSSPRVGLLSVGEERQKGNRLVKDTFLLLEKSGLNFVGNVEGRHVPSGEVDVVVCDGFVGNVILKFTEGMATSLMGMIRESLTANWFRKAAAAFLRPAFGELRKRMDYAEYGGTPLLGLNGVAVVGHGRSDRRAIRNAVRVARQAASTRLVDTIRDSLSNHTE